MLPACLGQQRQRPMVPGKLPRSGQAATLQPQTSGVVLDTLANPDFVVASAFRTRSCIPGLSRLYIRAPVFEVVRRTLLRNTNSLYAHGLVVRNKPETARANQDITVRACQHLPPYVSPSATCLLQSCLPAASIACLPRSSYLLHLFHGNKPPPTIALDQPSSPRRAYRLHQINLSRPALQQARATRVENRASRTVFR